MKNFKKVMTYLAVGLMLVTTACDDDSDDNGQNDPVTLLSKLTFVDDDSDNFVDLEYNSDNQLVKITDTYTDEDETETYVTTLSYSSDGKIAEEVGSAEGVLNNKTVYTWTASTVTLSYFDYEEDGTEVEDDWKAEYTLDSEGKVVSDTYYWLDENDEWVNNSYNNYTWINNNIEKYEGFFITEGRKSALAKIVGRMQAQQPKLSLKSANDELMYTSNYTFDDKINPYKTFGILVGTMGQNANNFIEEVIVIPHADIEDNIYTYTYEYNEDNYPTKRTTTFTDWEGNEQTESTLLEYIEQ